MEDAIAISYNEFNKHSIVAYNVGYHKDTFGSKQPSLENKVVFAINKDGLVGRGGNDGTKFHYALLDWGDNKKFRRDWLIRNDVIQANQSATQRTFDNWLNEAPERRAVYNQALNANNRN